MDEEKAGEATSAWSEPCTDMGSGSARVPLNQLSPGELRKVMKPRGAVPVPAAETGSIEVGGEETQKWRVATSRWRASAPTGAFDSAAVSFRFMPRPSWVGDFMTVAVLYGAFIGLPALGAVWAWFRISGRL